MKDLMKALMKGKKEEKMDMSQDEYDAKVKVLEELKELAMELMKGKMGDKLTGIKEVSVAAPDKESLKSGLMKAKEMMDEEEPSMPAGMSSIMGEDEEEEDEEEC